MQNRKRILLVALLLSSGVLLSGCGSEAESPEQVVKKFKAASIEVESGKIHGTLDLEGFDGEQTIDLESEFDVRYNRQDDDNSKSEVQFSTSGNWGIEGQQLSGDLDLALSMIGSDFYFKVDELELDLPEFESFKPLLIPYTGRWLQVDPSLLPETLSELQERSEEQKEAWEPIFLESNLFDVEKEFGVESVNGNSAYHYGIEPDAMGLVDYLKKASELVEEEEAAALPEDMDEVLKTIEPLLGAVSNAEIWIGSKDYYMYRLDFELDLSKLPEFPQEDGNLKLKMSFTGDDYNKNISIKAPEDSEIFNPLSILFGAAALNGGLGGEGLGSAELALPEGE